MTRPDVVRTPSTVRPADGADTGGPLDPDGGFRLAPAELVLLVVAALLVLLASTPLPTRVAEALPDAMTVRSNGTAFPWLQELVDPIVARTGYVLLIAVILGVTLRHPRAARLVATVEAWPPWVVNLSLAAGAGAWYGWLSHPHNGFPSNSRIHWVDIFFERSDEWVYVAVKLPHLLFYDVPWLWRAITAAALVLALFALGAALRLRRVAQIGLASTVLVSGNVLLFASTAEDVLVNFLLITLFLLALLRGGPALLGLATFGLWLGRPWLIVFGIAAVVAHAIATRRDGLRPFLRWAAVYGTVVVVLLVGSQALFSVIGERFLLTNGMLVNSRVIDDLPQAVDGFVISPFSGAYALHALWVFPAPLLVAATYAVVRAKELRPEVATMVLTGLFGSVLLLLTSEVAPLIYYNVRYITYVFPFILLAAWSTPLLARTPRRLPTLTLVAVLALAPVTIPRDPIEARQSILERPEMELWEVRDELRAAYDGGDAWMEGGSTSRNFAAYLLKGNVNRIDDFTGDVSEPGLYIVTDDVEVPAEATVVARTDSWVAFTFG